MFEAATCPDDLQLERIVGGQVPPGEAESFAVHLESCTACAERLERSLAGDTLLEAVLSQSTLVDQTGGPELAPLVERLLRLRGNAETDLSDTDTTWSTGQEPWSSAELEQCHFLAPALAADEMGRLGSYRVLRLLGFGGMGLVFQAEDVQLRRKVALKVMTSEAAARPGARERFLREAQAAAAIEHEHIVTIHHVGEDRGVPYLAMQWLQGMSLEQRLERLARDGSRMTVPEMVRIGRQVALGLAAAHANGLIHRDIKPANIWLQSCGNAATAASDEDLVVKILDFGLARVLNDEVHLTKSGTVIGTPAYMAPEQARGEPVDPRCDLFSLGVVLYRMATGKPPFRGNNTLAVLSALALDVPAAPRSLNPELPADLSELIMNLLSKDPAQRPDSARRVVERLRQIGERAAAAAHTSSTRRFESSSPPARRRALLAALCLLALAPFGWFFGQNVVRFATNRGEVVVVTDHRDIEVVIKDQSGTIIDRGNQREYTVRAGAEHDLEVTVKDQQGEVQQFGTKKFTVRRGGREVLRVELQVAKAKVDGTPGDSLTLRDGLADRRAGEWVLSMGGKVRVRIEGAKEEMDAQQLPPQPFELVAIDLTGNQQVRGAELHKLAGLPALRELVLRQTQLGDDGIEHLRNSSHLRKLDLGTTRVSDVGVKQLASFNQLSHLILTGTRVTDSGMQHIARLDKLVTLFVDETMIGDTGVSHIAALTKLKNLSLDRTQISDSGLRHLAGLSELAYLAIGMNQISDAGLKHLAPLKNLNVLELNHTKVTGSGLEQIARLTRLQTLGLYSIPGVTETNSVHLQSLHNLQVLRFSSKGTDLAVLRLGELRNLKELLLTGVTDADLEEVAGLTRLHSLRLEHSVVTDTGLAQLHEMKNLKVLRLYSSKATVEGVARLKLALPQCKIESDLPAERVAELLEQLRSAKPPESPMPGASR